MDKNEITMVTSDGVSFLVDAKIHPFLSKFQWRADRRKNREGAYVYTTIFSKKIYLHRLVCVLFGNGHVVDHINLNKLDNTVGNLRLVDPGSNVANSPKRGNGKFRGVWLHQGKWVAEMTYKGKSHRLRRFSTPEDAARAFDKMCVAAGRPSGVLNFPEEYEIVRQELVEDNP